MIKIEKLSYGFPAKDLYNNISFNIERGQHCALIGSNGTGKSTLVDMIMDPEEYLYDGKIIKDDECRIGYASQFSVHDKSQECTVFEYLSRRFVELQMEIARVCEEMATADPEDMEKVFEGTIFPARSAVEVAKLPKDALVEIEAIAYKK